MRRASRGRLEAPVSWREVCGKDDDEAAAAVAVVLVPLESCVLGCVDVCVGGLGFGALDPVAGGVEMPFWRFSATGDAIVGGGTCARFGSDRASLMLERHVARRDCGSPVLACGSA